MIFMIFILTIAPMLNVSYVLQKIYMNGIQKLIDTFSPMRMILQFFLTI